MPLTKIEAEIEIPEGFEFDRIDNKTNDGDYNIKGNPIICNPTIFNCAQIILRKKPKPDKPAYRVYIDKEGTPYVARKSADGNVHQTYEEVDYITDWIEYDQPKKWPTPLVERIAAIDIKAAEWIVEHWDDLLNCDYSIDGEYSRESERLHTMFRFSVSPQGYDYWCDIRNKLRE